MAAEDSPEFPEGLRQYYGYDEDDAVRDFFGHEEEENKFLDDEKEEFEGGRRAQHDADNQEHQENDYDNKDGSDHLNQHGDGEETGSQQSFDEQKKDPRKYENVHRYENIHRYENVADYQGNIPADNGNLHHHERQKNDQVGDEKEKQSPSDDKEEEPEFDGFDDDTSSPPHIPRHPSANNYEESFPVEKKREDDEKHPPLLVENEYHHIVSKPSFHRSNSGDNYNNHNTSEPQSDEQLFDFDNSHPLGPSDEDQNNGNIINTSPIRESEYDHIVTKNSIRQTERNASFKTHEERQRVRSEPQPPVPQFDEFDDTASPPFIPRKNVEQEHLELSEPGLPSDEYHHIVSKPSVRRPKTESLDGFNEFGSELQNLDDFLDSQGTPFQSSESEYDRVSRPISNYNSLHNAPSKDFEVKLPQYQDLDFETSRKFDDSSKKHVDSEEFAGFDEPVPMRKAARNTDPYSYDNDNGAPNKEIKVASPSIPNYENFNGISIGFEEPDDIQMSTLPKRVSVVNTETYVVHDPFPIKPPSTMTRSNEVKPLGDVDRDWDVDDNLTISPSTAASSPRYLQPNSTKPLPTVNEHVTLELPNVVGEIDDDAGDLFDGDRRPSVLETNLSSVPGAFFRKPDVGNRSVRIKSDKSLPRNTSQTPLLNLSRTESFSSTDILPSERRTFSRKLHKLPPISKDKISIARRCFSKWRNHVLPSQMFITNKDSNPNTTGYSESTDYEMKVEDRDPPYLLSQGVFLFWFCILFFGSCALIVFGFVKDEPSMFTFTAIGIYVLLLYLLLNFNYRMSLAKSNFLRQDKERNASIGNSALVVVFFASLVNIFFVEGIRYSSLTIRQGILLGVNIALLGFVFVMLLSVLFHTRDWGNHFLYFNFGILGTSAICVAEFHLNIDSSDPAHSEGQASLNLTRWIAVGCGIASWVYLTFMAIHAAMFFPFLDFNFRIGQFKAITHLREYISSRFSWFFAMLLLNLIIIPAVVILLFALIGFDSDIIQFVLIGIAIGAPYLFILFFTTLLFARAINVFRFKDFKGNRVSRVNWVLAFIVPFCILLLLPVVFLPSCSIVFSFSPLLCSYDTLKLVYVYSATPFLMGLLGIFGMYTVMYVKPGKPRPINIFFGIMLVLFPGACAAVLFILKDTLGKYGIIGLTASAVIIPMFIAGYLAYSDPWLQQQLEKLSYQDEDCCHMPLTRVFFLLHIIVALAGAALVIVPLFDIISFPYWIAVLLAVAPGPFEMFFLALLTWVHLITIDDGPLFLITSAKGVIVIPNYSDVDTEIWRIRGRPFRLADYINPQPELNEKKTFQHFSQSLRELQNTAFASRSTQPGLHLIECVGELTEPNLSENFEGALCYAGTENVNRFLVIVKGGDAPLLFYKDSTITQNPPPSANDWLHFESPLIEMRVTNFPGPIAFKKIFNKNDLAALPSGDYRINFFVTDPLFRGNTFVCYSRRLSILDDHFLYLAQVNKLQEITRLPHFSLPQTKFSPITMDTPDVSFVLDPAMKAYLEYYIPTSYLTACSCGAKLGHVEIIRVHRVVNSQMQKLYEEQKDALKQRLARHPIRHGDPLVQTLMTDHLNSMDTFPVLTPKSLQDLDEKTNETLLFLGTTEGTAAHAAEMCERFDSFRDPSHSANHLTFYENFCECERLSKSTSHNGVKHMFLARVMLGCSYVTLDDSIVQRMDSPPLRRGKRITHDSVVLDGDRETFHRKFLIFRKRNILPQYWIEYTIQSTYS